MSQGVEVLWISDALASSERCVISGRPGDSAIEGVVTLPLRGLSATIRYSVATTADWSTRLAIVEIEASGETATMTLERTDRGWLVDGVARPDLDECTTVDLGWSPASNTLPLRRDPLAVGESRVSNSAWLRFPELDVVAAEQTYTRLAPNCVRYDSATFSAELVTTSDDIVETYGEGLWRTAETQPLEQ